MSKELTNDQKYPCYEQNAVLCRAVQSHPCLYDRAYVHSTKEVYEKAWEDVATACEDTTPSCKVRWRNIRTAFIRSRQTTSKKRPPNRTRDYYLHDVLEFYIPHMAPSLDTSKNSDTEDDEDQLEADKRSSTKSSPNSKTIGEKKSSVKSSPSSKTSGERHSPEKLSVKSSPTSKASVERNSPAKSSPDSKSSAEKKKNKEDELTTSADETAEDEQKSPKEEKSKVNTFFIKDKPNKVGTFIIKKVQTDVMDSRIESDLVKTTVITEKKIKPDKESEVAKSTDIPEEKAKTEKESEVAKSTDIFEEKTNTEKEPEIVKSTDIPEENINSKKESEVAQTTDIPEENTKNVAEKPVEEQKNENERPFRFRRACKRGLDKSMLQQLRHVTPKRDTEAKRTRRSISSRRATLKPSDIIDRTPDTTTTLKPMIPPKKLKFDQVKEHTIEQHNAKENVYQQELFTIHPSDVVETQMQTSPVPAIDSALEWLPHEEHIEWAHEMPTLSNETVLKPDQMPAMKYDQAVQCEVLQQPWDDEFLNTLRPQMAIMNARQRIHFKQKVYKALLEVFDDASNFPQAGELDQSQTSAKSPGLVPSTNTTTAEMRLIHELVSMVQAAKLSPEFIANQGNSTSSNSMSPNGTDKEENLRTDTTSNSLNKMPPLISNIRPDSRAQQMDDKFSNTPHRHLVRKFVKVSGNATVVHESDNQRIYRILPKNHVPAAQPPSSVGTFIIPRAPGSIATSTQAASTAAFTTSSGKVVGPSIYREIPVSGGTMLVSSAAQQTAGGAGSPDMRRIMTVRSTYRPSTTTADPRKIMRRYSVCGSGNMPIMRVGTPPRIITTSTTTPTSSLRNFYGGNNGTVQRRVVRATTAMPPFRISTPPTTMVTQSFTTRTSSSATSKMSTVQSGPPSKPATVSSTTTALPSTNAELTGFSGLYSKTPPTPGGQLSKGSKQNRNVAPRSDEKSQNRSSTTAEKISKQNVQSTADFKKTIPTKSDKTDADTAGTITSDNFIAFNIKNEPIE